MQALLRVFICGVLAGLFTACGGDSHPGGNTGQDAMVDGGGRDTGVPPSRMDGSVEGGAGSSGSGSRSDAGPDGGGPSEVLTSPTSISPSGGSAVGQSDNYRLQVVVGAPQPMSQGSSANFKLRIGARLEQ